MKKITFLFFGAISCFGVPIGNPASPAIIEQGLFIPDTTWSQPRAAFLENFVLQIPLVDAIVEGSSQLGVITWAILERFEISLVFGSGKNYFYFQKESKAMEFQSSGGLIWYGDGKLILLEMKDTVLSIFGEAGGWDWMSGPFYVNQIPLADSEELKMRFWQVGAAVTQRIGLFSPYAGIVANRSRWKASGASSLRFHQKYPIGPFLGCTLCPVRQISLNVEWRGWIEYAWTVGGEVRF